MTSAHVLPAFLTMRLNNEGSVSQGGQAGGRKDRKGRKGEIKQVRAARTSPQNKFRKKKKKKTRTHVKKKKNAESDSGFGGFRQNKTSAFLKRSSLSVRRDNYVSALKYLRAIPAEEKGQRSR